MCRELDARSRASLAGILPGAFKIDLTEYAAVVSRWSPAAAEHQAGQPLGEGGPVHGKLVEIGGD